MIRKYSFISGLIAGLILTLTQGYFAQATDRQPASLEMASRLIHAKELLGKYYDQSIVKMGERINELYPFVQERISRALKGRWNKKSQAVAKAIVDASQKYGFDPIFVMAVIENESSFSPTARGPYGEVGLMQIRPTTAEWVAKKFNVPFKGEKTLENPIVNIQLGTAYLSMLRDQFDAHSRLYLSAYNMGAGNVHKALDKQVWPKDYVARVMHRYVRFYGELSKHLKSKLVAEANGPKMPKMSDAD